MTVLLLLSAGCCFAKDNGDRRSVWDEHKRDAWVWASKLEKVRLTKSHVTMPYQHGLSVASRDRSNVLRYYFSMGKGMLTGLRHFPFKPKDILIEFDVAKEQYRLLWPNAEWEAHVAKAQGKAFRLGGLSRSHFGGAPWFEPDDSLVHDETELVALRYHMAFVMRDGRKAQELREARKATHVIQLDLKTEKWSLIRPVRAAETNIVPLELNPEIEPGVSDITKQIADSVCDGITVVIAKHDVRPTYIDAPSQITAELKCDAIGEYTINFEHPKGTNQPPISLSVTAPAGATTTNSFTVHCPAAITNRLNDTLVLEWRGLPGRGPSWAGYFFTGIKKKE
jgi:hypothetical protein